MNFLVERKDDQDNSYWYHGLLAEDNSNSDYKIFLVTSGILSGHLIYLNDSGELVKDGFKKELEGLDEFLSWYGINSDCDVELLDFENDIQDAEDFKEQFSADEIKYALYLRYTNSFELIVVKKLPGETDCSLRFDETTIDGFRDFYDLKCLDKEIEFVKSYMSTLNE